MLCKHCYQSVDNCCQYDNEWANMRTRVVTLRTNSLSDKTRSVTRLCFSTLKNSYFYCLSHDTQNHVFRTVTINSRTTAQTLAAIG